MRAVPYPLDSKLHLGASLSAKLRFPLLLALIAILLFSLAARAATLASLPTSQLSPRTPVDFTTLPWTDGESLTYLISWTGLDAAQGTFTAHQKSEHWEFDLALTSLGALSDIYPFTASFWCIQAPSPWRSTEYGEYRFEPKRTIKERTRIDYTKHLGTREMWGTGETKTFPIAEDSVDDVGTMLYHLRAIAWQPGDHHVLHVYESNSEKEALAECQGRETRAFGTWPSQPLLRLLVLPGKGTHHRGHLMLWMTDDARHLPLHADLAFRYGTFSIDLTPPK